MLQNWNLFRVLRLALGIAILVQGIQAGDGLFALAGGLFTLMALLNAGCCAGGVCTPATKTGTDISDKTVIHYEEVADKK